MSAAARGVAALVVAAALAGGAGRLAFGVEDPREVQGRVLFAKGEYQAALDIYATLFAERSDPLYLRNIGRCNQKLRRPDRAIDAFREYLRRARKVKAAERQEVEGFIREMEELRQEQQAISTPPPSPPSPPSSSSSPSPVVVEPPAPTEPIPAAAAAAASEPAATVASDAGAPAPARASGQTGRLFLALAVGSGFGIASGEGEVNPAGHRLAQAGFAPAQLGHAAPEIGVFVLPRLLLSAQLRLQYVTWVTGQYIPDRGDCGADAYCEAAPLAVAGFGRVAWLFGDGPVHLLAGVAAGGGSIRHAQVFATDRTCGLDSMTQCVDSLSSGPFLLGPSLAVLIGLGDTFNLMVQVNTQIGVPRYTLNFDVNGGVALRL